MGLEKATRADWQLEEYQHNEPNSQHLHTSFIQSFVWPKTANRVGVCQAVSNRVGTWRKGGRGRAFSQKFSFSTEN